MISTSILLNMASAFNHNLRSIEYYSTQFSTWQAEFDKGSSSNGLLGASANANFAHRLQIFSDNDDIIQKHNSLRNSTYTLGHNQFSCLNSEEFAKLYLNPKFTSRAVGSTGNDIHTAANSTFTKALRGTTSVDWVARGAVTNVKNQGQCGSCWAFSTTGALEGAYYNKVGTLKEFSEQQLVSCDSTDNACGGGLMDNAFKWIKSHGGLCTESSYPYTASAGTADSCSADCSEVLGSSPMSYVDVEESDEAMMSALDIGPVSVAIEADKSAFQLYKSGVLTTTECGTSLDHGVLAVGYGTDSDGTAFYLVKNSWGGSWGESGYIRMERGTHAGTKGMCGILSGPPSYPKL